MIRRKRVIKQQKLMNRSIKNQVRGFRTQDGAGVSLVRVLGNQTTEEYDPILMLDSFDSTDPSEYVAGFPLHPHRGIETISYLYRGRMVHSDTLGNREEITDGEVQWMNAGSGIEHAEEVPAAERLLGVQLWLNLPATEKMSSPYYHSIRKSDILEIPFDGGYLRLLAGNYKNYKGFEGKHLPLDYYDIHLEPEKSITINTSIDRSVMLFTLLGEIEIEGEKVPEKTAAKLTRGDVVTIKNIGSSEAFVLFMSSKALNEPIAWAGPIVMNTRRELQEAFDDLDNGNFIREELEIS